MWQIGGQKKEGGKGGIAILFEVSVAATHIANF
jgi:hypothetical protein